MATETICKYCEKPTHPEEPFTTWWEAGDPDFMNEGEVSYYREEPTRVQARLLSCGCLEIKGDPLAVMGEYFFGDPTRQCL